MSNALTRQNVARVHVPRSDIAPVVKGRGVCGKGAHVLGVGIRILCVLVGLTREEFREGVDKNNLINSVPYFD